MAWDLRLGTDRLLLAACSDSQSRASLCRHSLLDPYPTDRPTNLILVLTGHRHGLTHSTPEAVSEHSEKCDKVGREKPDHIPSALALGSWSRWALQMETRVTAEMGHTEQDLAGLPHKRKHQSCDQSTTAYLRGSPAEAAPSTAPAEPRGSHFLNHTN